MIPLEIPDIVRTLMEFGKNYQTESHIETDDYAFRFIAVLTEDRHPRVRRFYRRLYKHYKLVGGN